MTTRTKDTTGTTVALLLGGIVGALLASPVFPENLNVALAGSQLGPVGSVLLIAALAVIAVPVCILALFVFFAGLE